MGKIKNQGTLKYVIYLKFVPPYKNQVIIETIKNDIGHED